jgi:hypothetical protein
MVVVDDGTADRETLLESDEDALIELVPNSVFENDGEPEEDGQTVAEALKRRLLEIEVEAEIERVSRAEREVDVLPRGERDIVAAGEIDGEPEADLDEATDADSVTLRTEDKDAAEEGDTAGVEESIDLVDVKVELGDRVKSGDTVWLAVEQLEAVGGVVGFPRNDATDETDAEMVMRLDVVADGDAETDRVATLEPVRITVGDRLMLPVPVTDSTTEALLILVAEGDDELVEKMLCDESGVSEEVTLSVARTVDDADADLEPPSVDPDGVGDDEKV